VKPEIVEEVQKEELLSSKNLKDREMIETKGGQLITLEEAIERYEVCPVIERFGIWAVTDYGLECLALQYFIEKDRLKEPDWIDHIRGKTWVYPIDFYNFTEALQAAIKYHHTS
jgi:hypothetical protein